MVLNRWKAGAWLGVFLLLALLAVRLTRLPFDWSWLPGEVCRTRNCYCEPFAAGRFVLQPLTALSNLGFVLAGALIGAWRATRPASGSSLIARARGLGYLYAGALILAGVFSFFSHASLSRLGEWFDLMGVYAIAGFMAAYAFARLAGAPVYAFGALYALLLCIGGVQMVVAPALQQGMIGAILLPAVIMETAHLIKHRPRTRYATLAVSVTAFAAGGLIWAGFGRAPNCPPASGWLWHVAWHLLAALAAGLLFVYYVGEKPKD